MTHQSERNIPHLRDIFGFHSQPSADYKRGYKSADSSSVSTNGGNDSAISIGSTSEEELALVETTKKKKQRSRRDKAMTETDVRHLERHLSMKKTIRKKIMRDLQQAFVEDPNEFRVEDVSHDQLKELNLQSLSFGPANKKKGKKHNESNFLDFLRTDGKGAQNATRFDDEDSGHGSPTRELSSERNGDEDEENRKTSFWRRFTMKKKR